jgi:hypothetical protein
LPFFSFLRLLYYLLQGDFFVYRLSVLCCLMIQIMDFRNIKYLKEGNDKQRLAYSVLKDNAILDILHKYDPILVGTIPICIDIETSDLDIICCFNNKQEFIEVLEQHFYSYEKFSFREIDAPAGNAVVCSFYCNGMEIEVFGQEQPTLQQAAYRHMIIEHKILQEKGEDFRQQIITLKKRGYKTEPAFTLLLGLEGNPYQALLDLEID